ncbi:MAG: Rrf2 family transcriptional regulator [Betaproteobacteria bacterium]|nr:Rrf2 family transcriptional regulator [Betaproteobacteria bacterium]
MQLTRFTDYSLRVLIYLAAHPARLATIPEVAAAHRISQNHLMKVVHQLGLQGFIATQRGKGGGMRLARPPEEIRLGDVVRAMEENMALAECFDLGTQGCALLPGCGLKGVLLEARANFLATLDRYTLADIARPAAS